MHVSSILSLIILLVPLRGPLEVRFNNFLKTLLVLWLTWLALQTLKKTFFIAIKNFFSGQRKQLFPANKEGMH